MASVCGASPDSQIAQARQKFLARGSARPPEVREAILASWRRSREWSVAADRIESPYIRDPDLDTPLMRSALPVLGQLRDNLADHPVSAILTDAAGVVLSRMTMDDDLERHLDKVMLASGFSYAEASVGTNGIGTALEGGQPACVGGHEHYTEQLADLMSVGVPLYHPISGKLVGAVGLACWCRDDNRLLMALAKTTADQVTRALLTESSAEELELLQNYLRACRHSSGIVLALNQAVVMMNDQARHVLEQGDQEVLLGYASEVLAGGRTNAIQVEMPTGLTARMHCRPAYSAKHEGHPELRAAWCRSSCWEARPGQGSRIPRRRYARDAPAGHCGVGAPCGCVAPSKCRESYQAGEWLALEGEPGSRQAGAGPRGAPAGRNPARGASMSSTPPRPKRPGLAAPGPPRTAGRRRRPGPPARGPSRAAADACPGRRAAGGAAWCGYGPGGRWRGSGARHGGDRVVGRGHAVRAERCPHRDTAVVSHHRGVATAASSHRGTCPSSPSSSLAS